MTPRRAGCTETGTSGSEGGPGKRTDRKVDTAPRSDPYHGATGISRALFTLSANAARDADDLTRWALALASEGVTHAPAVDGSPGDPRRALALLLQADAMLDATPPHPVHPWVVAQAASKAARLGDRDQFDRLSDRAVRLQGRGRRDEATPGFYDAFPSQGTEGDYLDDYRGAGLVLLRHPAAASVLLGITARTQHRQRVAEARRNLMQFYADNGDHDAAADAGLRAVAAARIGGLDRWVRAVRGVRARGHARIPAYRQLDEVLAER